jgi:hypothetical protein
MSDIVFSYQPYQKQLEIHQCNKRFKIICAGRRAGKTLSAAADMLNRCYSGMYDQYDDLAWIAPTFQIAERGLDAMKVVCKKNPEAMKINNTAPKTVTLLNGVRIKFLSSDSPDRLRGYGFKHIVVDEADYVDDYVWSDILRPALSDKQGTMTAISTPRRKGTWFNRLYLRGNKENKLVQSFSMPSSENPYFPVSEFEEARMSLPEDTFKREYLAIYTDNEGEVFQNIDKCIHDGECTCQAPEILGLDLAKHEDFTVITKICEKCQKIKEIHRWNNIDWTMQRQNIKNVYINSIAPIIYIDSTGIGDVIYDDLLSDGCKVKPFRFTNVSKQKLISNLRLLIMQGCIKWSSKLKYADMLQYELECYQIQETRTGMITYNAPSGIHDDLVISLALGAQGLKHYIKPMMPEHKEKSLECVLWTEQTNGYDFGDSEATLFL